MIMMMMITQGGLVTFQSDLGRSWAAAWPPILPDKILNTHHTREDHGKEKYKIQKYKRKIQNTKYKRKIQYTKHNELPTNAAG